MRAHTAVGRTAEASAAAVRAGISRIAEHPFTVDAAREPLRAALAAGLPAAGRVPRPRSTGGAGTSCAVRGAGQACAAVTRGRCRSSISGDHAHVSDHWSVGYLELEFPEVLNRGTYTLLLKLEGGDEHPVLEDHEPSSASSSSAELESTS